MLKLLALILTAGIVFADPAPLGLELGKATVKDAKKLYRLKEKGINKYSLGPMFTVPISQTNIEGLKEATLIFDERGKLVAVILEFPKSKWNDVYKALRKKYRLIKSKIPFVGDRYAEFKDGKTLIMLDAPHLSFDMSLVYARKEFLDAYDRITEQERKRKESQLQKGL
ncbi:MAG: hypothetical protein GXO18_00650 [Aquificae bacterium]|nr:hypothetical protein [Aquificota bacterium]